MNVLKNGIIMLSVLTILSGCTSLQKSHTDVVHHANQNTIKRGETGVCVMRADSAFYNSPFIAIDGKPVGQINSTSYAFNHLSPGTHKLSINQGYLDGTLHYQFQVKPGQVTYLNMAWGKLNKNQTTPLSMDNAFASSRGWVVVAMNEQTANDLLGNLHST